MKVWLSLIANYRLKYQFYIVFLWIGILSLSAIAQISEREIENLPTRSIEKGDYCIVGDESHDHLDRVFLYKGRWVGICPPHVKIIQNEDSLAFYFARLQPKGALYQEDAVQGQERPIRYGWFIFGVWVAVALFSAALSANVALRKGLPAIKGFFIGLIGSLIGLVYLLIQPAKETIELPPNLAKIPNTAAPNICPGCGNQNHPSASKCSNCGYELSPSIESEVSRIK